MGTAEDRVIQQKPRSANARVAQKQNEVGRVHGPKDIERASPEGYRSWAGKLEASRRDAGY